MGIDDGEVFLIPRLRVPADRLGSGPVFQTSFHLTKWQVAHQFSREDNSLAWLRG